MFARLTTREHHGTATAALAARRAVDLCSSKARKNAVGLGVVDVRCANNWRHWLSGRRCACSRAAARHAAARGARAARRRWRVLRRQQTRARAAARCEIRLCCRQLRVVFAILVLLVAHARSAAAGALQSDEREQQRHELAQPVQKSRVAVAVAALLGWHRAHCSLQVRYQCRVCCVCSSDCERAQRSGRRGVVVVDDGAAQNRLADRRAKVGALVVETPPTSASSSCALVLRVRDAKELGERCFVRFARRVVAHEHVDGLLHALRRAVVVRRRARCRRVAFRRAHRRAVVIEHERHRLLTTTAQHALAQRCRKRRRLQHAHMVPHCGGQHARQLGNE